MTALSAGFSLALVWFNIPAGFGEGNMHWFGTVATGLIGLAVGSFLNVCIDRLPAGESILAPASHCRSCRIPLRPADLIPLLSYLMLRGKCRYCLAAIPLRVFLVELATGSLFALAWYLYGFG